METKFKPRIIVPNRMKRSSSSNSDANFESPHSPLRLNSPLPSDHGDPPESPPFVSPMNSPAKSPPADNSLAIVAVDKFTQCTPQPSPLPPSFPPSKDRVPPLMVNRAVREEGPPAVGKLKPDGRSASAVAQGSRRGRMMKAADLGLRICEVILCLISFSVMAADKTQGWSGDSYDRYKEYRYCLSVNVIAFVYSAFQACDVSYRLSTSKDTISHHSRNLFNFLIDQILAYLLISASSSAATRVDDWQSNWGKDEFTQKASASVAMSFLAFVAFAVSSIISGYNLWNDGSS